MKFIAVVIIVGNVIIMKMTMMIIISVAIAASDAVDANSAIMV
jgi:hypothetical protein